MDIITYRTTKALSCAWMASKQEVSAVGVKAFKSFQIFGEYGQSCGVMELEGHQYGPWLISERSYPWTVEPAGLNSSIWPILSGEGSGGELERCLRWRPKSM